MRWLYNLLLYLLSPLLVLRLWQRGRRAPAYRRRWRERFALQGTMGTGFLWVHAVSVGEVMAAAPLVRKLMARYPQIPFLVTTMTPTGSERVQALFGDQVRHVYAPYDLPGAVNRFLHATRPRLLLVIETELWPNWIAACHRRNIPVVLANARLSARSARGYQRVRRLAGPMLRQVDWIAAQGSADANRFVDLGADPDKVSVTGSIKFDVELPPDAVGKARTMRHQLAPGRPAWIAASTHEGEDELMLEAHRLILEKYPETLLILVPRHPERFETVAQLVITRGFSLARRSCYTDCRGCQVLLGDTMGELLMLFGVTDVAFVGGSLVIHGGHNPMEPALWQLPVLSGPHVFNFQTVFGQMQEKGGLAFVDSAPALAHAVIELFEDDALRQRRGAAAYATVESNRGALQRLTDGLDRWLREP